MLCNSLRLIQCQWYAKSAKSEKNVLPEERANGVATSAIILEKGLL